MSMGTKEEYLDGLTYMVNDFFALSHMLSLHRPVAVCVCAQSCLTLGDPMDCSLSGSCIHGILQARTLEWVAVSLSRRFSQPRDGIHVSPVSCPAVIR